MRFLKLLFIISILHVECFAQNTLDDKKAISMLKEFYIAHEAIEAAPNSVPPKVYILKSDALQKKHCTVLLIKQVVKYREMGIDYFTHDNGIDAKAIKTMTIVKDPTLKNSYIITYTVWEKNYPKTPFNKHVVLHICVINDKDNYKINSVK
jgi:hypothetical protein